MATAAIQLIVGLGNPGNRYQKTRHNAGFWFLDALARHCGAAMRANARYHGEVGQCSIAGHEVWLLKPDTFMNRSGQSIAALAGFYKIPPQSILVAHDDLDLPPGALRLKLGGGHGGHNGLRDTIQQLGSPEFHRLRIGIGHPGHKDLVHDYVLGTATAEDRQSMEQAIDASLPLLADIVQGDLHRAMNHLHRKTGD